MSDTAGQIPALRALSGRMAAADPDADEAAAWDGGRSDLSSTLPTRPPPPPLASTTPPITASAHEEHTVIERRNSAARLQAALEASTRTDATLSGLFRAIQHLTDGVSGAREANESLIDELEGLRGMLGVANEQQLSSKHKLALLEQSMERQRQNAELEKNYLISQHDAFIAELIDDHEAELDTLRTQFAKAGAHRPAVDLDRLSSIPPPVTIGRRSDAQPAPSAEPAPERAEHERQLKKLLDEQQAARETLLRLQAQRDEAQGAVSKLARERDEALVEIARLRTELGGPRVSLSPQPPQVESRRTGTPVGQLAAPLVGPASTRSAASADSSLRRKTPPLPDAKLELDQAEMDAALKGADAGTDIPRLSPPPEELRAALTGVHFPPLNVEPPRSPLKQKPDPSTRPLIGYSLGADSIRPERLEGVALSSKPPSGSRK